MSGRAVAVAIAVLTLGAVLAPPVSAGPAGPAAASPPPGTPSPALAESVTISASQQRIEGDLRIADGFVDIRYRDMVLQAQHIELNAATKDLVAVGGVVLQEGTRRLVGERLEFNLESRTGTMYDAWGYSDPEVFFAANSVGKIDDRSYKLRGATVTSCNQPTPQWRIKATSARYKVDRYIQMWNARLEIFGVPILYLPFLQIPARRERSTGFLMPSVGSNSVRGFYLGNAFFWAIGRSYDATLSHDYYKQTGSTYRLDFEYVPSTNAAGSIHTENQVDKITRTTHSQYRFNHNQRLGDSWRLFANVDVANDDTLDRQFSQSIARISRTSRSSTAFLQRNWSRWFLSLGGSYSQSLAQQNATDLRLPSLSLGLRDTSVVGPTYGSFGLEAVHFSRKAASSLSTTTATKYERVDFEPRVSAPLFPFPWLQFETNAGYRLTYYTKSYLPGTLTPAAKSFLRQIGSFGVTLRGPLVRRIFNTPNSGYAEKFRHSIEPSVTFGYTSDYDPERRAFTLAGDGADYPTSRGKALSFGLRNSLSAKRRGLGGQPWELVSLDLTMGLNLDPKLVRPRGPIDGRLRLLPVSSFETSYDFSVDTYDKFFARHSLHAIWRPEGRYADVTFSRIRSVTGVSSSELRALTGFELFGRIQLGGSATYNVLGKEFRELASNLIFRTQCCGLGVAYRRLNLGTRNDNEYRFSLTFKNVGTVFDYALGDKHL